MKQPDPRGSILFILPSLTSDVGGGIERSSRELVTAAARHRPAARLGVVLAREPRLLHQRLDDDVAARLEVTGVASERRGLRIAELAARATALAARLRPSLIWCAHLHHAPLGYALSRALGAKLAVQAHGVEAWALASPGARAWVTAHVLARADALVAVSSVTAARLAKALRIAPARIEVLHNAVDTRRFAPGAPSAAVAGLVRGMRRPRLLSVARLDAAERYKGVDIVLRALATPAARALRASYLVVGDGTDRPRLAALADSLGVEAHFLGRADETDLADLYRAADLFVLPSRGEGFGIVFAEAAACGLPVIAGSSDGSVDALGDGALGLLVDPLDAEAVAAAIVAHATGTSPPELRDGARLHREVEARFSRAAFALGLGGLLDRLA